MNNNVTIVTGLWDLGRGNLDGWGKRDFSNYKTKFFEMLETNAQKLEVINLLKYSLKMLRILNHGILFLMILKKLEYKIVGEILQDGYPNLPKQG